jgi:electron transfer flavoprotein beta subunit
MNIAVCVKQILDTTDVKFDAETGRMKRDGQPVTINSLDEYAVEEGLRLKEKHGGTVTVISMGPAGALETIRHAIAMGADEAVHLCDAAFAGADTVATVYALSRAIAQMGAVDLIICGAETVDGNTAYVGPALAQSLQIPYVTFANKIEEIGGGKMVVQRMMEQGYDRVECALPALITVVKGINEPRISSLKGKMRAKKYEPKKLAAADVAGLDAARVGQAGSTSRVVRTLPPKARPGGQMFEGEPDEVAEKLHAALSAKN